MKSETAGITRANEGLDGIVWNILGQTYVPKQRDRGLLLLARDLPARHLRAAAHPPDAGRVPLHPRGPARLLARRAGHLRRRPATSSACRWASRTASSTSRARSAKCLFWVSPTGKLYDLFWGIHNMSPQTPDAVVALSAKHDVEFLPPPSALDPPLKGRVAERSDGGVGRGRAAPCGPRRLPTPIPSPQGRGVKPPSPAPGEARLLRVAAHDRLALGVGQHRLDVVEAVRRQRLDGVDDAFRAALAVGAHDLGRLRQALGLVGAERRASGARPRPSASARQRASRIACEAPFEPTGYIGCAASPSSVTRPCDQRGSGSRSHIGYSQNSGVAAISASHVDVRDARSARHAASARSRRPGRDQSSRRGGGVAPSPTRATTAQLVSLRSGRASPRRSDRPPSWPRARRRRSSSGRSGRPATRSRRARA